jgi:hypothetical protein
MKSLAFPSRHYVIFSYTNLPPEARLDRVFDAKAAMGFWLAAAAAI